MARLINRKVCADDRKYQRLDATNRFCVFSGISHNYFACNASSRVIAFHYINRSIRRIVLACEMAMEGIHLEVSEIRSYLRAIEKIRISGVFQPTSSVSRKEITHVSSMFSDVLVLTGERRSYKRRRFKGWIK